jgi:hypothetical protein
VAGLGLAVPVFSTGCAPKAGGLTPPTGAFSVSDYFAPSGAMGDGATPGNLVISANSGCKARPANARGACYTFQYAGSAPYTTPITKSTGVCNWAGLFWQYPDNNWGASEGLPVPTGVVKKVTFQVAVAANTELMTFQIGGIGAPPLPDGGPAPPPPGACPPAETPTPPNYDLLVNASMQQVGTEWQKIEIPILARDPSQPLGTTTNVIGAFSWSLAASPGLPKTIYVDDLVYE